MGLPDINFESIRSHDGSRHAGFEELISQLAALEPREANSTFVRKGRGGDAGVECFTKLPAGAEHGWQAKYLFAWDASLKAQLDDSITTALEKHPKLSEYIVCLPFDLPDVKPAKGKSARAKWDEWKAHWEAQAAEGGRKLEIRLWDKSSLASRLTRDDPHYAGRLVYWFGIQTLTRTWFEEQFTKTRENLGSRYTPESHVDLPVRRQFLALVRDPEFSQLVRTWAWKLRDAAKGAVRALDELAGGEAPDERPSHALEAEVGALAAELSRAPSGPNEQFPFERWNAALGPCVRAVHAALDWTFAQPSKKGSMGVDRRRWAQHSVHELLDLLNEIDDAISSDGWTVYNRQAALLVGPAGIGKSHLLADVVEQQIHLGRPAIMVLGSTLADAEPWRQIMTELDLSASQQVRTFLGSLDAAGQAAGVRALICVDALNERHGIDIWPHRLAAFLKAAENFPYVCVALSCRTTFVDHVVPDELTETRLQRVHHPGFGGERGAAARYYLSKRGIVRPGAPNLLPEFNSPLFLKTCCDALEREGRRELPKGLRGVTSIFAFYNAAIAKQLNRRLKLDPNHRVVERAIEGFSQLLLDAGENYVARSMAIEAFERLLPSNGSLDRSLLAQLESEGLLAIELVQESGEELQHVVRFTFERFSDHMLASRILEDELATRDIGQAFSPGERLHGIAFGPNNHRFAGIVEALAVQLPERCDVELPDFGRVDWVTGQAFKESLLWRHQSHFTERTLELVRSLFPGDCDDILLSVATEPDNRFNATLLDKNLRGRTMPERDLRWSRMVMNVGEEEGSAIETLISWALESGDGDVEPDRARLAALTLTWLFTTSHRWIRDRATKALATLLSTRLQLATELLEHFAEVDDLYLKERLYAAVYGAVMQGATSVGLIELGLKAFELVFAAGAPPMNALLRDHAYGLIKYVEVHEGTNFDGSLLEPPHESPWPPEHVPDEVIESFLMDYGSGQKFTDPIVSSTVNDGDFARYVIDTRLDDWSPAPIGSARFPSVREVFREWLDEFEGSATYEQKQAFNTLFEAALRGGDNRPIYRKEPDAIDVASDAFRAAITPEQWEDYRVRAANFVEFRLQKVSSVSDNPARFDTRWARRWICKRAHDLGWSAETHGKLDRAYSSGRNDHRVERIGKKYQWLAFHELAARMSDNLAYLGAYRNYDEGEHRGHGTAREAHLRHIDPSLLVTRTNYDGWAQGRRTWWSPVEPKLESVGPAQRIAWLSSSADILNDVSLIDLTDPKSKRRWLSLQSFSSWRQDGFSDRRGEQMERDTWYRTSCLIVREADEAKLLAYLSKKIMTDPSALPKIERYGELHLGEYHWHPAVREIPDWVEPNRYYSLNVPTRPTVVDYLCERGGYDYSIDKSISVNLPAPWLAWGLGLRLTDGKRLNYADRGGRILFFDPSVGAPGPDAALVDRDAFLGLLKREALRPVWVVAGEKGIFGDDAFGGRMLHTAIYKLSGDAVTQHSYREEWEDPSTEQLAELFNGAPVPPGITTNEGHYRRRTGRVTKPKQVT